jgi:hypothetical protein
MVVSVFACPSCILIRIVLIYSRLAQNSLNHCTFAAKFFIHKLFTIKTFEV